MDVHKAERTGHGACPQGWSSIQEEAQGFGKGDRSWGYPEGRGADVGEMFFLESLSHIMSVKCPGNIQEEPPSE